MLATASVSVLRTLVAIPAFSGDINLFCPFPQCVEHFYTNFLKTKSNEEKHFPNGLCRLRHLVV